MADGSGTTITYTPPPGDGPIVIGTDGTETRVTPDVILDAANYCTSTTADIEGELDALRTYIASLEGRYTGVAAVAFHTLMLDFNRQSEMVKMKLEEIRNGLWAVYHNYTGTESQNLKNTLDMGQVMPRINL